VVVSPGQAGDSPALVPMLGQLRIARRGPGRPRTRPELLRADKAYSSKATREHLRRRGIQAVIPEPADQTAHRRRRGPRGGRPVTYDPIEYKNRNTIERAINLIKQWRGLATRYDKHALTYRGGILLRVILAWLH
jgi:transposase